MGPPTAGPSSAYSGTNCAGTDLGANYPASANSRLIGTISPTFGISLPATPEDGTLLLNFWHWFSVSNGDTVRVEIKGDDSIWRPVSRIFIHVGGAWTKHMVDISEYAGETIQIGLKIIGNGDGSVSHGWFVDDIEIVEGLPEPWLPEDFEAGIDGWYADHGIWEVGEPTDGPSGAHTGQNCLGTVLGGDYNVKCDSRFISSEIELNAAPQDGALWLEFWHYFSVYSGDTARVEIRVDGGEWEVISDRFINTSNQWTRMLVDISAYAGQTVQIAFHIDDDGAYSTSYPYPR